MRSLLIPIMALAVMGASDEAGVGSRGMLVPGDRITNLDQLLAAEGTVVIKGKELQMRQDYLREVCRDRVSKAREILGQPPLMQREPASPERPLAVYAVDKRLDGCGVMVMMGNRDDIRPLPDVSEADRAGRLIPAESEPGR